MRTRIEILLFTLLVAVTAHAVTTGGPGAQNRWIMPEAGASYGGQKHITTAGTVDVNSGGQGVRVKVDSAGIAWSSSSLDGVTLSSEALVSTNAARYAVDWHVAIDGTQGKRYLFEVIIDTNADPSDGSPVDQVGCHNDFSVQANTHSTASGCCLVTMAAGEYLYLAVTEPGAGAGTDFDVDHGGLTIHQY